MNRSQEHDQYFVDMQRSAAKRLSLVFFWIPGAVFLLILIWPLLQKACWVGRADLEVEFAVTDATTGQPIPDAHVEIHSEGGFYKERDRRDFQLVADANGHVSYVCLDSMSFGSRGPFTDTFFVHLPWWRFRSAASGYEANEWTELDVAQFGRQVKRMGPGKARLEVPIALHPE